jgi:hypothetical protein
MSHPQSTGFGDYSAIRPVAPLTMWLVSCLEKQADQRATFGVLVGQSSVRPMHGAGQWPGPAETFTWVSAARRLAAP